ncbi:MAG: PAS domain S-box protein [Deltaproteobacteria bacterium]|nr:PAS domain S-box protein [Deltaproteobacteria bacterium]
MEAGQTRRASGVHEARLRELVEHALDGVFVLDGAGVVREVNRRGVELLGATEAAVLGTALLSWVQPSEREYLQVQLQKVSAEGGARASDLSLTREDGQGVLVDLSAARLGESEGEAEGVLVFARDATERNRMARQLLQSEKLATMGAVAANVAHAIEAPALALVGDLGALRTSNLTLGRSLEALRRVVQGVDGALALAELERQLATVDALCRSATHGAERIRDTVRDLKNLARMDDAALSRVRVNQCLDAALGLCLHELRGRAQVERDYGAGLPEIIASPGRVQQVFLNLIVHAAQSMEDGPEGVNVLRLRSRLEGDRIRVDVSDTGRGLGPEGLGSVFDPFQSPRGTGLGLSIVQDLVRRLGGELRAESAPGQGTTFSVFLSQRGSKSIPPQAFAAAPAPARRVLLIDDEPDRVWAWRSLLRASHEVTTALGGRAAMEQLSAPEARFDRIVCDLQMPDVDGVDLYRWLAERFPGAERTMIFLSEPDPDERVRAFLAQVPNPRLLGDFTPDELDLCLQGP